MAVCGMFLMYMAHGTTFFYDEWDYVMNRFGGGLNSFLKPHNEHFSLIPVAIYKTLFHLVGMQHYPLYRLVLVVMHLICVWLVFDIARRRIGAWPALVAAVSILCLFTAWQNLLWAFQMSFVGSTMGGLAAWALIDRDTRATDIAAGVALGVALACSGLGIPFVPGIAIELAWQRRWRRLWLVAVPFALYVLWYTQYGVSMVTNNTANQSPQWILEMAAAAVGGLFGRDTDWGVPLTVLLVALAGWRIVKLERLSARFVGAFVTGFAFWILTGISRSTIQPPDESRYVYLGAVCVVVMAVELLPALRPTGRAMGIVALILVATTLMGWETMYNNAVTLRQDSQILAAQLGAMQLEQSHASAAYTPSPDLAPNINAGLYFHAMRAMGSGAGDSIGGILDSGFQGTAAADVVLLQLLAPGPVATPAAASGPIAPRLDTGTDAVAVRRGGCLDLRSTAATASADLFMPAGGVLIRNETRTPVALGLRRFSLAFTPIAAASADATDTLAIPLDSASHELYWHLQLSAFGRVAVCGLHG